MLGDNTYVRPSLVESEHIPTPDCLKTQENPFNQMSTPAPQDFVDDDEDLAEESGISKKTKMKILMVAAGLCIAGIVIGVVTGTHKSSSSASSDSTLNNGNSANQFSSVWMCQPTNGSNTWSSSSCTDTCDSSKAREIKCCKPATSTGNTCDADSTVDNCDINHSPSLCMTGPIWYCQQPGTQQPTPTFSAFYCSSTYLAPACSSNQTIYRKCCDASSGVFCTGTALDDSQCIKAGFADPKTCSGATAITTITPSINTTAIPSSNSTNVTLALNATSTPTTANVTIAPTTVKPTPKPTPAPTPAPTPGPQSQKGITIYNNCPGTDIFYGGSSLQVPDECMDGSYCGNFNNDNPAFWAAPKGNGANNYGARTLAELNFLNGQAWYDISLVKGFNYGVKIEYRLLGGGRGGDHDTLVCTNVNCADAYWICDTSNPNVFNPNYVGYNGNGYFTVTFCPDDDDSTPPPAYQKDPMRIVHGSPPFYCNCGPAMPPISSLVPQPGTILSGNNCGPIIGSSNQNQV